MKPVIHLTASATSELPRWLLFTICIVYASFGLFGRDPWKNEDAAGFGVMWTMANGTAHDWLLPNLVGKYITSDGPLGYWLGAAAIRSLTPWMDASNASRVFTGLLFCTACIFVWYAAFLLGRRAEVQPFKYAFGGEPKPHDYGRTLADGALLILLACFGLAERGHETTPLLAQFVCIAMLVYGLVRAIDKPIQGSLWCGFAIGLVAITSNPVLMCAFLVGALVMVIVVPDMRMCWLLSGMPIALIVSFSWPLAALQMFPNDAVWFLHQWMRDSIYAFAGPPGSALCYAAKNLPLFTWPAWPLAMWAWFSWAGLRRAPHIVIPLSVTTPLFILVVLQSHPSNQLYMLFLPTLAVFAAFALPTLKRGAINAIDWFAVLSFTIVGTIVWLVWLAALTGFPTLFARNLARYAPGFTPQFKMLSFFCAVIVTLCWFILVQWRVARHPKVLWRSVVLSSGGTTLMWVLLMTLWLPVVNYSRTYKDVAKQIAAYLPTNYTCISPIRLGDAQIATFAYFGNMHFSFDKTCNVILRQSTQDFSKSDSNSMSFSVWKLVWEGRRATDCNERFQLYVRINWSQTPC